MKTDELPGHHVSLARDTERALLGVLITSPTFIAETAQQVTKDDFQDADLGRLFEILGDLTEANVGIDPIRLKNELIKAGLWDEIGAKEIAKMCNEFQTCHPSAYVPLLLSLAKVRRVFHSCRLAMHQASQANAHDQILGITGELQATIDNVIRDDGNGDDVQSAYDVCGEVISDIENAIENKTTTGLRTGLNDLDTVLGGFFPGELSILAARPSVGKSALALDLAARIVEQSMNVGKKVVICSLEMTSKALGQRLLSRATGFPVHRFQDADFDKAEIVKIKIERVRLMELGLSMWSPSSMSIRTIEAKARLLRSQKRLDFLVVDYLGLIHSDQGQGLYERVTNVSNRLMQLAKRLDIPVLALCQLNRDSEKGSNGKMKQPGLADLRDSGAIEQDAHVVILLHREERNVANMVCDIAKNRNRPIGPVPLKFDGDTMRFTEGEVRQTTYHADFAGYGAK